MNLLKYKFLTDIEKSHIEDFLNNREIIAIAKKKDILKRTFQFIFLWIGGGYYLYLGFLLIQIEIFLVIMYFTILPAITMLLGLIVLWRIWPYFRKKQQWRLDDIVSTSSIEPIWIREEIKKLRRVDFLESIQKIEYIDNIIDFGNSNYGAELLTSRMEWWVQSRYKQITNFCFIYKFNLDVSIKQKLEIIKIRDLRRKLFIMSLVISLIFTGVLYFGMSYWALIPTSVLTTIIYKLLIWMSWEKKRQWIWNNIFDKKYEIIWRKSQIIKKLQEIWFFDDLTSILDPKTTYEIYVKDKMLYVKIDFLRSHISRINFIYWNIFNFRGYKQTMVDFYLDTVRAKRIQELLNKSIPHIYSWK